MVIMKGPTMNTTIDKKRLYIFLGFAFGIAWITALVIYLTGGLVNSPALIPGTNFSLALVLLAVFYMGAPAAAHVLTRVITRQGWANTWLRPHFKRGWPFWVAAWFLPGILTVLGMVVYFLIMPHMFDSSLSQLRAMYAGQGVPVPDNLWMVIVIQTFTAMLISPILNSLFTLGEEFGWRAYLQPLLMPLGPRKAMLWIGVIWGVWHWPVILMGHNYGLEYPGSPWLGPLAMVWFCFISGTILGWLTWRGGSVWPAVIGHSAINGIAAIGLLVTAEQPNMLLGPAPTGVIALIPWTILAAWLLLRPGAWQTTASAAEPAAAIERSEVLQAG
jgi:uncharacterized protein